MTDQISREALPVLPAEPTPLPAEPTPLPPAEPTPMEVFGRRQRVPRPLVGVSLWCFGALFWSYLVVGEIVVWTAVPEALGVLAVLGAFGIAWHHGTSQIPRAAKWRRFLPATIAFFSWLLMLAISTAVFDTNGRSKAEVAALLLWSFAATSYALGRRLTALEPVSLSPRARAGRIALWLIAGIATLLAGINIISYA